MTRLLRWSRVFPEFATGVRTNLVAPWSEAELLRAHSSPDSKSGQRGSRQWTASTSRSIFLGVDRIERHPRVRVWRNNSTIAGAAADQRFISVQQRNQKSITSATARNEKDKDVATAPHAELRPPAGTVRQVTTMSNRQVGAHGDGASSDRRGYWVRDGRDIILSPEDASPPQRELDEVSLRHPLSKGADRAPDRLARRKPCTACSRAIPAARRCKQDVHGGEDRPARGHLYRESAGARAPSQKDEPSAVGVDLPMSDHCVADLPQTSTA